MDELRIKAYKTLVYQALIDIRVLASQQAFLTEIPDKTNNTEINKHVFHIANTFHNLALQLTENPPDINEKEIWRRIDFLINNFPKSTDYNKLFEYTLRDK
ncbi:hypothetical protein [Paenibacillus sp. UNC217MF]|uniref:hypothetical protein n=1 Tax=Paenibacillus sp. UNC217MF TaxID=1449062 RepID=UPI0004914B2B|nr:hypothetical protein [Paenibacillus sp. UNC217MF]